MHNSLDRRRTLWVVDDSATDAERVRRVLSADYQIEVIRDGAAALEKLTSCHTSSAPLTASNVAPGANLSSTQPSSPQNIPDLLLIDWVMPGISGLEVCQYVRAAHGKLAQVPIILLTAQNGTEEVIQAFNCGANDYVSKPFVDEELRARVRTLIHSRKLLERAENAEADVRSMLMNAPDPIFAIDAQGRVTFANAEALNIVGRDTGSIIGRAFSDLAPGFSYGNISIGPGASLLPLPDVQIGERIYSPSLRILPSDDASGTTVSLRDVTDRRRDEARRLDFYSVIAHDLRTPITSVLMRIQLAFRGKHGVLPPTLTADLRRIEASLRSQVGMVNDFLELAKLEGVGYKIDRQPVEMNGLIESTMQDFEPLLEKSNIVWQHAVHGTDGSIKNSRETDDANAAKLRESQQALALGDRQRLMQVLANLIGNAIKFTPGSGVITTAVTHTDEHIETTISDTGRGIAQEEIPHLFERFTRARESAGDTIGSGLGLMIVREIVEAHGGVIGVESEPGVGSKFWFRLPRCAPAANTPPPLN